jgi:hypothetical protein
MTGLVSLEVLHSVRDGDVVWVTVQPGMEPREMDVIRDVLCANMHGDATIIVTPAGFLESIRNVPLSDLVALRDQLESAISTYMDQNIKAEA